MAQKILAKRSGFTLIELVITIAIVGLLAALAVPAIANWLPNYRLKGDARDLFSNMQKAKLEAVKRNTNVGISFTPGTYNPSGKVGSYLIFVDDGSGGGTAGDGVRNGSEQILVSMKMGKNVTLYLANFVGGTSTGYNSRGLPMNNLWGRVELRNNQSHYYQITLSSTGALIMKTSNDGTNWN